MNDVNPITQNEEARRLEREAQRWAYVKQIARERGMSLAKAASYYSIDKKVIKPEELSEVVSERKSKRKDKYSLADKFVSENLFEVITPAQLAEVAGFSYPTAVKYINNHPHHFRKVGRGRYEIRDPKSDKEHEHNMADSQE